MTFAYAKTKTQINCAVTLWENKDADQLCIKCTSDQRQYFLLTDVDKLHACCETDPCLGFCISKEEVFIGCLL